MATLTVTPLEWSITHTPASATVATITKAAVNGASHVCRSICASVTGDVSAGAAVNVYLRDGLTGAGTIIWSSVLRPSATASDWVQIAPLSIVGTPGNAMTLEFSAAPGTAMFETVSLTGFTTNNVG